MNFYDLDPITSLVVRHQMMTVIRALSSSLLRAIITRNHVPFFKIFSNFVHFWANFQIFCSFFDLFKHFFPFFWKIAPMPLLSRIGPDDINYYLTDANMKWLSKKITHVFFTRFNQTFIYYKNWNHYAVNILITYVRSLLMFRIS